MIGFNLPFNIELQFLHSFVQIHNCLCIVVGLFYSSFVNIDLTQIITCEVHLVINNKKSVLLFIVTTCGNAESHIPFLFTVTMYKCEKFLELAISRWYAEKVDFA